MNIDLTCLLFGLALSLLLGTISSLISYHRGRERAFKDMEWKVIPICRVSEFGLLFWKSTKVKYGYQFQLFMKGAPSLKSEETIIEEREVTDVDQEKLQELTRHAVKLALTANTGGVAIVADRILDKVMDKTKLAPLEETVKK